MGTSFSALCQIVQNLATFNTFVPLYFVCCVLWYSYHHTPNIFVLLCCVVWYGYHSLSERYLRVTRATATTSHYNNNNNNTRTRFWDCEHPTGHGFKHGFTYDLIHICLDYVGIIIESNILTESEQVDLYSLLIKDFNKKFMIHTIHFELLYSCYNIDSDFNITKYKATCLEQKNTLILIKNEFGNVFGGFTSCGIPTPDWPWSDPIHILRSTSADLFHMDPFSFLYRIRSKNVNLKPQIFRIKNNEHTRAMSSNSDCIVDFGCGDLSITLECYVPMIPYPAQKIRSCITRSGIYDFNVNELVGHDSKVSKIQSFEVFRFYN